MKSIFYPGVMLRVEGAALFVASVSFYWFSGGSWLVFALLLLSPDLSMLGYLTGVRTGAAVYNVFHAYPLPAALALFGVVSGSGMGRHCRSPSYGSPTSAWIAWSATG